MNISKTKIKFGTDGWRAVIADAFTFANVGIVAENIADYLKNSTAGPSVCVGYDNRFLSPEFALHIAGILENNGVDVDLSETAVSTPCVSHRTNRKNYDLGIMVSASHNPSHYNGIKIKENYGGSASDETVSKIIAGIDERTYKGAGVSGGYSGTKNNWTEEYVGELASYLPENDLKVACDFMYGTGYPFFDIILSRKGYQLDCIHNKRDPLFGGSNPEPKPATLTEITGKMSSGGYDVGFAFDGDGDRIAVIDENGNILSAQIILAILAWDLLEQGKKEKIVKSIAGTYLIDRMAAKYDVETETVPIGFKNICAQLNKGGFMVGGEESGGMGFGDYLPERDALYTSIRLLDMIKRRGMLLGDIWNTVKEEFGNSVYIREDFPNRPGQGREQIIENISSSIRSAEFPLEMESSNDLDGMRIDFKGGAWLLMRPSGTEPLTRIYAEAEDEDICRKLIEKGKELL